MNKVCSLRLESCVEPKSGPAGSEGYQRKELAGPEVSARTLLRGRGDKEGSQRLLPRNRGDESCCLRGFARTRMAKIRGWGGLSESEWGWGGHTTGHLSTRPQPLVPSPGQETFLFPQGKQVPREARPSLGDGGGEGSAV